MTTHAPMRVEECHRMQGRSMLDGDGCRCFQAGLFLECPPEARTLRVALDVNRRGVFPASWSAEARGVGAWPPEIDIMRDAPRSNVQRSGDFCDTCGSANMIRTGSCLTCADCGTNNGACS